MQAYEIDSIIITADRQRQEFDAQAMEDLRASIDGKQLLHAPVVRMDEVGRPVLVSGERRLRAIRDIFALGGSFSYDGRVFTDSVPTVTTGELTLLEAEELEFDENFRRKDLTWQEHANAVVRLKSLRDRQAAARGDAPISNSALTKEVYPQAANTPDGELGGLRETVRKELIVAKHLDNPEVAKAKTLDEAFKILKRSEQSAANIALATSVGATFTAELHKVENVDCLAWMDAWITDGEDKFDIILTDPPYGMGADSFGDGDGKLKGIEHRYKDSPEEWRRLMKPWAYHAFNITKSQAHAYVFCDFDRFHELKQFMQDAGWYVFRTPIIDRKLRSGRVPLPDRGPRRTYELILYAIKGNKPVNHIYDDVIDCEADPNMTHGAQKPIALYQNLLMRSAKPGDRVLDTFAGSGTILPACHKMQCIATAIEQEPEYFGMCVNRLKELKEAADPLAGLM
jgi:DNA modification methylase